MVEIMYLISMYSAMYGIDPRLVEAIIQEESGYNTYAIGKLGERGLMQIRPQYFLGDKAKMFVPKDNIENGIKMLAKMKKMCSPKLGKAWPICFNLGASRALKIQKPTEFIYYRKLIKHMRAK